MNNLLPGTPVVARGLQWEVIECDSAGEQQRFRLRCVQGALRGQEMDLLSPFETIEPLSRALEPAKAGLLRAWRLYHQAFLLEQALGSDALLAVQPGRLDPAPYQWVPVMRAIQMSRPRLLLADGVGLGKTVQAGLVLTELLARRRAHRILIVSPAGPLLNQWREEMHRRFGVRFQAITDWGMLEEKRRELLLGANPFDAVALCLLSIDFAKQEKVLQDLERASWDVVVIDEAHHCIGMGNAGDREDSQRRRLAEVLARQADALLLLTATPHDGYDAHFASLMELLDPSLVDGRGALRGDAYRRHVIRRLKRHLTPALAGDQIQFHEREVLPRRVAVDGQTHPHYATFQTGLLAVLTPCLRQAVRKKRYGEVLAFVSLLKRSVSTVQACRNTLDVIARRYAELEHSGQEQQESRRQRLKTLRDYRRRLERYGALSYEEEQDQSALEAEDIAAELFTADPEALESALHDLQRTVRRERDHLTRLQTLQDGLQELLRLAQIAEAEDPKLAQLIAEIQAIRADEPQANILVYTEYTDSQTAVLEWLRRTCTAGQLTGEVLAISGMDPERVRTQITERFGVEDRIILVSTDATAEGLNLHRHCHHLIHVELPYNPNRLEQRNGRIDRYGQTQIPRVRYLYLGGTFEERLLWRLVAKYENQRQTLTFMPNTLGLVTQETHSATVRLLEGLANEDQQLFQGIPAPQTLSEAEQDDPNQPAYRELLAEMERALGGYRQTVKNPVWLGEGGLNAETRWAEVATTAQIQGAKLAAVDLNEFVCTAVEGAGGRRTVDADGVWSLVLPPDWTHGLQALDGYDEDHRTLRITLDPRQFSDRQQRPLGFLGRAHPLVQRAIERVRNVQFAGSRGALEQRVSAARIDAGEPALLWTFLCTVQSGVGREYERVLAVRVNATGEPQAILEPGAWEALTTPDRAIPTADVWERWFAAWGWARQDAATEAAAHAFQALVADFGNTLTAALDSQQHELAQWLTQRTTALCGIPEARQTDLFINGSAPPTAAPTDPVARLRAFSADLHHSPAHRREADGVLRLYDRRLTDIAARRRYAVHPPFLLGLLMLIPGEGN
ncbi:helicase-related protein [Candidatus Contendibacter odensensis]|uniref:Helicase domain protein n=1 Tax=Candidatus Contendobacter odensis Run_B_J11 TaxID=1400861 RepID=A0A7U7GAW2_9GAMM|nr:helicase-related protein [Candidatus Contendobacter odensis]CDH44781.1 Helicase domain protein [Candidatus Contendobacter odensis Run_B_J11]